ncbi:MAG TPA: aromatic ring-hydroxylating dioxygenase subunit alpha, partial [Steroidobacteraceae bacterium]|nr:aromatic ring-hydroxylating dioxygenase subunit alpha [Steroidobacteraceae bacterium]
MLNYLGNAWYAAAHGSEVTAAAPFARTLLEQSIVFYRDTAGRVTALENRCPHRFAPLSRGRIRGDEIECGYHGLRFGRSGVCSHNPHGPVPPRARVRAYPVIESQGYIWLWPGEPSRADPALLPTFMALSDEANLTVVTGYLHVKANYQLIVDNLLDLSHALFVHPHFAIPGQTIEEQLSAITTKTLIEGDVVTAWRLRRAVPPNGPTREIFGFGPEPVDSRSHMKWHPPALLDFDVGACLTGTPEATGLCMPQAHLITPETPFTSHYFFAAARNLRRDDPQAGQQLMRMLDLAFREQDEPMIEAVQSSMGATSDLDSLDPLLLRTDGAPVAARRILQKLIAAEREDKDG